MIKSAPYKRDFGLTPDLTPLLDIIFIVMVFLMLTAAVKLDSLDVSLPTSDSAAVTTVASQSLTINITAEAPYWAIDGQAYLDWHNFTLALREAHQHHQRPIVIGADKHAQVQHLVKLLAFLQDNGIPATQLLTEKPSTE